MNRCVAAMLLIFAMLAGAPTMAQTIEVRIERLSPATVHIPPNTVYPEPLRFRVVRAIDGAPLAGIEVYVTVEVINCLPIHPCPFDERGYFGEFLSNAPTVSDADGIVETSLLRAGWRPNVYLVSAWPPLPPGYTLAPGGEARVQVNQWPLPSPIPGASHAALAALAAFVLMLAIQQGRNVATRR